MNRRPRNANENFCDRMRATADRTLLEHSERMAKQEERMSTHQAKYESALDRLRADMAKRDAQRDADAAKRDAGTAKRELQRDAEAARREAEAARREAQRDVDMAKRDKDNSRWQIGMWVTAVLILGAWIRRPF